MRTGPFLFTVLLAVLIHALIPHACGADQIPHNEVKGFAELVPITPSEKADVRLNPNIIITYGSQAYPAVNEFGQTSGGLKPSGSHMAIAKALGTGLKYTRVHHGLGINGPLCSHITSQNPCRVKVCAIFTRGNLLSSGSTDLKSQRRFWRWWSTVTASGADLNSELTEGGGKNPTPDQVGAVARYGSHCA
uniref:RxLR effector candidate protein n=1 Tax=Hyaloperonospora arabidopsidis (strain Emoy2) TaxID=559515 RepID=M4BR11_HYAAE